RDRRVSVRDGLSVLDEHPILGQDVRRERPGDPTAGDNGPELDDEPTDVRRLAAGKTSGDSEVRRRRQVERCGPGPGVVVRVVGGDSTRSVCGAWDGYRPVGV